jgi:hypothetical protein
MVRHIVNGNQLLPALRYDARDIFLQFGIVLRADEILPSFNSKNDMDINLRIGIGHVEKMPSRPFFREKIGVGVMGIGRAYGACVLFMVPFSTDRSALRAFARSDLLAASAYLSFESDCHSFREPLAQRRRRDLCRDNISSHRTTIPPLRGERAGVREGYPYDFFSQSCYATGMRI